jgi:hypothetical protein
MVAESIYKPFDPALYAKCDEQSKRAAFNLLTSLPYYRNLVPLSRQKELYNEGDFYILFESERKRVTVEVEQKLSWTKQGKWQGYPTIDIPYRKRKSKSQLFVLLNSDRNTAAVTRTINVLNSPVSKKDTKYTKGEAFFRVPVDAWKFYTKLNDQWRRA